MLIYYDKKKEKIQCITLEKYFFSFFQSTREDCTATATTGITIIES